jgi:SpoVK/Ycf46/Vps4 family AAA+-type ATPase
MRGYFLKKLPVKTEDIIRFPETSINAVVSEIEKFWDKEGEFDRAGLPYKRGMILYGPPGTGKSCTVLMAIQDVQKRGGIAVKMDNPYTFLQCIRMLRAVQPNTPLVVVMEDIDSLLEQFSQTDILNILDGVEGLVRTVFLATTNYPEKLGARIINRPSRFDRRFEVPALGPRSRAMYLKHLISKYQPEQEINLRRWVEDTEDMSVSHLKELFVGVMILEDDYEDVIAMLKSMQEDRPDSSEYMQDGPSEDKEAACDCVEPQPSTAW